LDHRSFDQIVPPHIAASSLGHQAALRQKTLIADSRPQEPELRQTPARPLSFWNRMEQEQGWGRMQVIENVVARDGVEPPTPAFSGLRYAVFLTT